MQDGACAGTFGGLEDISARVLVLENTTDCFPELFTWALNLRHKRPYLLHAGADGLLLPPTTYVSIMT